MSRFAPLYHQQYIDGDRSLDQGEISITRKTTLAESTGLLWLISKSGETLLTIQISHLQLGDDPRRGIAGLKYQRDYSTGSLRRKRLRPSLNHNVTSRCEG